MMKEKAVAAYALTIHIRRTLCAGALAMWCVGCFAAERAVNDDRDPRLTSGHSPASQPATAATEAIDEYLRFIREAATTASAGTPEDIDRWWYQVLRQCGTRNLAIRCEFGAEPLGELFVRHFSKEGDLVDFLLLFGDISLYPPENSRQLSQDLIEAESSQAARNLKRRVFEWHNDVARIQVNAFCQDKSLFERYYHACMWAGLPFGPSAPNREYDDEHPEKWFSSADPRLQFETEFNRVCKYFPRNATPSQPYYWWYARQFLVMAKATMRDDLIEDAKPEELFDAFKEWSEWVTPHVKYLLPHPDKPVWGVSPEGALKRVWSTQDYTVPAHPFPTWKSNVQPPDQSIFRQIQGVGYAIPKDCAGIMRIPDCAPKQGREPHDVKAGNENSQQFPVSKEH